MSDPKQPEPAAEKPAEAKEEKPQPEKHAASDYVFKIVPLDPKNSFDFEDVADK